jgi:ribose transport system ATP-binding protein
MTASKNITPYLVARNLAKSYGATIALDDVGLEVIPGEVHAILGENGAGKSTLVKILNGIVDSDFGSMEIQGNPYKPRSVIEANRFGVSTAFQELSLLPNLSVNANMMMGRQIRSKVGLISSKLNQEATKYILEQFNAWDIDPKSIAGDLSLANKQRLEIVRALSRNPKLLVLDEPTAALAEPEWLFELINKVTLNGTAVIYISHRLAEVRRLCTRGTVLRGGRSSDIFDLASVTDEEIFRLMVGRDLTERSHKTTFFANGTAGLTVRNMCGSVIKNFSITVAKGEILGVAALEGQGQRSLFRSLAGVEKIYSGQIEINGLQVDIGSPSKALRSGIGFVPEERKVDGVFLNLSTSSNISLSVLNKLSTLGFINRGLEKSEVASTCAEVDLAKRFIPMRVRALSGGNQQKALLARVLISGAKTLVLFDPTRGVDVGTKQVIYEAIRTFVANGGSAIVYSTELSELVHLSSRCIVLYRNRVVAEYSGSDLVEDRLVMAATGHAAN